VSGSNGGGPLVDRRLVRLPLVALAALALIGGLWAGLTRLGWAVPPLAPAAHGPLMLVGFFGTLISLERAVAFRKPWAYAAPLCAGLAGLALLAGVPVVVPKVLALVASLVLLAGFLNVYRRYYGRRWDWPAGTLVTGAALWVVGNALWLGGQPVPRVAPWWVAFLVVTIAGERLELARVKLLTRRSVRWFALAAGVLLLGLVLSLVAFDAGVQVAGLGLVGLGVWLLTYDVTRQTIRRDGLARYVAACLLPGYVWLVVAGGLWLWRADAFVAGPVYDAMLHAVLVGFVLSMIFGHAPIILPAIAGLKVAYTPVFYVPLALLQASLVLRLWGDLAGVPTLRQWGGLLNEVAVLTYVAVLAWALARGQRAAQAPAGAVPTTGAVG
jgi:hypothetical protein